VANETVTMVTAIAGVTLASLSLGWQAATYHLTGGRAKVTLLVGAMGRGGMFTAEPHKLGSDVFDRMAEQGYRRPIVAVRDAIKANREALGLKRQYYVASVDLADGRTATSGNGLLTR
jgi:hypothetical protein